MQHPGPKEPADDCPLKLKAQVPNMPVQVAEAECALAKQAAEMRAVKVPEPVKKDPECPLAMTSAIVFDGEQPVKVCTLNKGGPQPPVLAAPQPAPGPICNKNDPACPICNKNDPACPLSQIANLGKISM